MVELIKSFNKSLLEVHLQPATPYMLRNDGELLECGDVHPYIRYNHVTPDAALENTILHPQSLKWFYDNTNTPSVKESIEIVVNSVDQLDKTGYNITEDTYKTHNREEIIEFLEDVTNETNQEFLRLRMSSPLYGGTSKALYARISSIHFDWYPLLWDVVENNDVSDITVVKDANTFGGRMKPYEVKGQSITEMPKDEFLTLSGNPIIEMYKSKFDIIDCANGLLYKGKSLRESYEGLRPRYLNGFMQRDISDGAIEFDIKNIFASNRIKLIFN